MDSDLINSLMTGQNPGQDQMKQIVEQLRQRNSMAELGMLSGDDTLSKFGSNELAKSQNIMEQAGRQSQKNRTEDLQGSQFENLKDYQDRSLKQSLQIATMNDQTRRDIQAEKDAAKLQVQNADAQGVIDGIGQYKMAPLSNARSPYSVNIMDKVMERYPGYDATKYAAKKQAQEAFSTGKQGDLVRGADVTVQHLDTADMAIDKLNNTHSPIVNYLTNAYKSATGNNEDLKAFQAAKQIVSAEVSKFIVGSNMALDDRKGLMDQLNAADNPTALKSVTTTLRTLMGGQLQGLKSQFEGSGLGESFNNRFKPRTLEALGMADHSADGPAQALPGATAAANTSVAPPAPQGAPPAPTAAPGASAPPAAAPAQPPVKDVLSMPHEMQGVTIVRTGKRNGKRVAELSNGKIVELDD